MHAKRGLVGSFAVISCTLAFVVGCAKPDRPTPLPEGVNAQRVRDINAPPVHKDAETILSLLKDKREKNFAYSERDRLLDEIDFRNAAPFEDVYDLATGTVRTLPKAPYEILILSGGSADGAYQAGMVVGWTARGDRPRFDVICGVSTGALVGALAFAGPEYDATMQHFFTTTDDDGILLIGNLLKDNVGFVDLISSVPLILKNLRKYGTLGDSAPLAAKLRCICNAEYLARVAAEHASGRRFYVGTTNLDTKHFVVWDMGEIASRCTPDAADLYVKILLASAAINAILPPVKIPVEIDGRVYEELHTDGGAIRRLFFQPPIDRNTGLPVYHLTDLKDSNMYVVIAGKTFGEPTGVPTGILKMGMRSLSTQLEANARVQMFRVYTQAVLGKMNPHFAAIPSDASETGGLASFDHVEMTKIFTAGYDRIRDPNPLVQWDKEPPEQLPYQEFVVRKGTRLTSADPIAVDDAGAPIPFRMPGDTSPKSRPVVGPRQGKTPAYLK